MRKGALFAFEGGDGVGKATQSCLLSNGLCHRGNTSPLYSFPRYDTPAGKIIGGMLRGLIRVDGSGHPSGFDPLVFQSVMLADKAGADREIREAIAEGAYPVCDRWFASALAYGSSDELPLDWLKEIHSSLVVPDLTFLLQVPDEVAIARRPGLRDRYEADRGKQERVKQIYAELAADPSNGRWVTIDGSRSVGDVAADVWDHVVVFLGGEVLRL
jgi:dTMP kinase